MNYNFNGKNVKIPNDFIEKNMRILGISKDEAIKLYLEDEGYATNEVVEELTEKAKEAHIKTGAAEGKKRKISKRTPKVDEEKENIIKILENALISAGFQPKIINKSKIIEFSIENNHYKLDLIKKRPAKKP